ncbi:MAG: glycosyltransferase family 4 protein [Gammaproteobacteria bacterium]
MRILLSDSGSQWGGQEYRVLLEHIYLLDHGHQSWLFCNKGSALHVRALEFGIPEDTIVTLRLRYAWRLDVALRILFFCLYHRVDVIAVRGSRDGCLCSPSYLAGVPVIRFKHVQSKVRNITSYKSCSSHVIACSREIARDLVRAGMPEQKISVVDEGVCLDDYFPGTRPAYLATEFNCSEQDPVILNVGMLRVDKGQQYFVRAAIRILERHPNALFLIAGGRGADSTVERNLKNLIRHHGLSGRIRLLGYREDVAELTRFADIVVLSSLVEAQSRVVPQAFACGKPVVATRIGGIPDLVEHGVNGLLVSPASCSEIAAAIDSLLENPAFAQKLASNGYEFAKEKLSFKLMMDKIMSIYSGRHHSDDSLLPGGADEFGACVANEHPH